MLGKILSMISASIGSSVLWLDEMFVSIGGISTVVLTAFLIYTAIRLLLKPFIGYASSDIATRGLKQKNKNRENKSRKGK